MPDNLPATETLFFALPDHAVIALEGPDATAFAQAQFANDAAALPSGHWQWTAWLTPKGRVIALFALLKLAEDRILLLLSDGDASDLAGQLQRFVFRRKLKIARVDRQASGAFAWPGSARNARIGVDGDRIELDYGDGSEPRTLRIDAGAIAASDDPQACVRWAAYDLRHGLPRLPAAQREQWTPQQLSLERLPAFSVKKGCYPGQEIVARTHFLGKAKRGLVLFEAGSPIRPGAEIGNEGSAIGSVVSTSDGEHHLALAVLPLEREMGEQKADGVALREMPLSDGLQR